jgi:hypothetical protein
VAEEVTAGLTVGTCAALDSERSSDESVLGVSAPADMALLTIVKATRPSRKETDLKNIMFTVTPQKSHQ